MMFSVGLYHGRVSQETADILIRLPVAFVLGFIILSVVFYTFPGTVIWRSTMLVAMFQLCFQPAVSLMRRD